MVCSFQAVPSHSSAPPPDVLELEPTASQKLAEMHETPARLIRKPLSAWAGFAVFCICHTVPFHTSASAMAVAPELSGREPTASQNAVVTQDTALRSLAAAPGGDTAC